MVASSSKGHTCDKWVYVERCLHGLLTNSASWNHQRFKTDMTQRTMQLCWNCGNIHAHIQFEFPTWAITHALTNNHVWGCVQANQLPHRAVSAQSMDQGSLDCRESKCFSFNGESGAGAKSMRDKNADVLSGTDQRRASQLSRVEKTVVKPATTSKTDQWEQPCCPVQALVPVLETPLLPQPVKDLCSPDSLIIANRMLSSVVLPGKPLCGSWSSMKGKYCEWHFSIKVSWKLTAWRVT